MIINNSPSHAFSDFDTQMMTRALELAARGQFSTAPNPRVGCVIVKAGKIIAEGWHQWAGEDHAEAAALKIAGSEAREATVYVTLEPCAHFGKTPPCVDALIQARVSEVIIACSDPNPQVAGKGIKKLHAAGIRTKIGVCAAPALALNRGFFTRMTKNRPFVTVKLAASMDGRTALANGESQWITGENARADVHFHRLCADAIIAGRGSVIDDNARLNARFPTDLPARQPLKVIIDSQLQTPVDAAIFADGLPVLLVYDKNIQNNQKTARPLPNHSFPAQTECLPLPCENDGHISLSALLAELGRRGINHIFVEAGAALAGAFLRAQLVDECLLYLAPTFLGADARALVELPPLSSLSDKICWQIQSCTQVGADVRITLTP